MARLNDDAQWIVLMGFLVSFGFFFLALVINQSTVVGQTTAESVIEFPKNDIRDMRAVIIDSLDIIADLFLQHSIDYPQRSYNYFLEQEERRGQLYAIPV